jgi:tRNA-splicing ligase RtcB
MTARQDPRLVRTDDHWLRLPNPWDVPVDICADAGVPLESAAVDEILTVLETAGTLRRMAGATPGRSGPEPRITRVVLTPDLHKGAGIPVGTSSRRRPGPTRTSGRWCPACAAPVSPPRSSNYGRC